MRVAEVGERGVCVCVSRGCRLGLASGRWRRCSLNNLTKPQPPGLWTPLGGGCTDSCSGEKGARQGPRGDLKPGNKIGELRGTK
jgi:hypothetical protein